MVLGSIYAGVATPTEAAALGVLGATIFAFINRQMTPKIMLECLLDGFSIVVMTLPIALPMVTAAGFDPIWFGIYLILMVEVSQITPPVGFNLFVIQGLTGEPIMKVAVYALPFFFLMLFTTVILTVYPEIVLYLPQLMTVK